MFNILKKQKGGELVYLPLDDIAPNKYQPRRYFDDASLEELKNSILEYGLLQPVTVRRGKGGYELIAGERRFRAAQLAGLDEIPAVIIESDEKKSAVLSLLENLQREDLTFFEIAQSYERLIHEQGMTQEEVAERIGKSRSSVANKLRLLRLAPVIQKFIRDYDLSERHARALLRLPDEETQLDAVKQMCIRSMTAEEADDFVSSLLRPQEKKRKEKERESKKRGDDTRGTNNLEFFKNTVRKAVDMIKKGGVDADLEEEAFDWGTEYRIKVKK